MFDDPFPEPFWARLEQFGQAPALKRYALAPENKVNAALPQHLSYQDLALAADRFVDETRPMTTTTRPLVVLEFDTCADHIAAYLGCLRAGWPVLLASPGQGALLADRFGAALHLFGETRKHLTPETPALHPDLALLLPTSGTTGDAKLVRLSHQNLTSNADSIANYLHLSAQDCAATTLPLHYSYGLSVLHSTLATGGSLSLIDRPLVDAGFWQAAQATQVTSLALVPVQCEMLLTQDRRLKHDLPSLRYVTQAGGKLPQDQALTLAKEAKSDGWDLVIMYGQTEASPRMAYLPPKAALAHSETIGQAIPGGQITLQNADGQEITEAGVAGELVYEGPNVMMGYARAPEDLAKPQGPSQLRTGDIAERTPDGFYKITGRAKRFVKIAGRRISLDGLESDLRAMGHAAYATGSDQQIRLYFCNSQPPETLTHQLATRLKVPATTFTLLQIAEPPLMPSGKVDYRALAALASPEDRKRSILADLSQALPMGQLDPAKSFAEHGGDSLMHLQVHLALTERLGALPPRWESQPIETLIAEATGTGTGTGIGTGTGTEPSTTKERAEVPSDLILRLIALSAVILLHATTWPLGGGTLALLLLVGVGLAKFQRGKLTSGQGARMAKSLLGPVLLGYIAVLGAIHLAYEPVPWPWFAFLGNFETVFPLKGLEPYWFVSAYAQAIFLIAVLSYVPALRRALSAAPWAFGLLIFAILSAAVAALGLTDIPAGLRIRHPLCALQLMAFGWVLALAHERSQKALSICFGLSIGLLQSHGLSPSATAFLLGSTALLLVPLSLRLPKRAAQLLTHVGSATLIIYLVHPIVGSVLAKFVPAQNMILASTNLSVSAGLGLCLYYGLKYGSRHFFNIRQIIRYYWIDRAPLFPKPSLSSGKEP